MIELAAPWLLAAAPLAGVPVLLHLVRRRRPRDRDWGAMRFLAVVAAEQRRRLAVQERLLLILRTLALAAAALAASRPAWVEHGPDAPVLARAGRVACVLAIDDSAAALAAGGADSVRALALAWLGTLQPGDEVTVLPLSRLTEPRVDPLVDLAAARAQVTAVRGVPIPGDHPGLLLAGLERLRDHLNPHAELVLVAGGRAAAWRRGDQRWDELARRLAMPARGSRGRPHVVVLQAPAAPVADLAITALDAGAARAAPRARLPLRIAVSNRGPTLREVSVQVELDERIVEELRLSVTGSSTAEVQVRLPPLDPGDHAITARLVDAGDGFPVSDSRSLALVAEARIGVLLVEAVPGRRLDGSLGAVACALDPEDGADPLAPFAPRRIDAVRLSAGRAEGLLAEARAVVLGGVAALDPGALAAVESWVAAGGGLLVVPGPDIDTAHWNRSWWRGGDGLLPCAAGPEVGLEAALGLRLTPGTTHPLAAVLAEADSALAEVRIDRALLLPTPGEGAPADASAPLLFGDDTPLVVERGRGRGRVALLATSLDGSWGDLPWRAGMVPIIRTLIADLAARPTPPRTLAPLDRPAFAERPGLRLRGPAGQVALDAGTWEGSPSLIGAPLALPGCYTLIDADDRVVGRRAVAALPEALDLALATPADGAAADALGAWRAADPLSAQALVAQGPRRGFELWPWLLLLALTALLAEGWLCGRAAGAERAP